MILHPTLPVVLPYFACASVHGGLVLLTEHLMPACLLARHFVAGLSRCLALQRVLFLETWRWCFFFAGFMPVHYISEGVVRVAEMVVESKLFTVQQALYFAVSIHVSPTSVHAVPCRSIC